MKKKKKRRKKHALAGTFIDDNDAPRLSLSLSRVDKSLPRRVYRVVRARVKETERGKRERERQSGIEMQWRETQRERERA